jgi:hypothetical protein
MRERSLFGRQKVRETMQQRIKRSMFVCMLTSAFTILLLAAQVAEAAPLTCGTWSVVPSPNVGQGGNDLFGVAAVSASDVWAVGTNYGQTLTEFYC